MKGLVDTGAACSILSMKIYKKIQDVSDRKTLATKERTKRHPEFYSANSTPITVVKDFEADVKVGGIVLPVTLSVVDKLGYDLILGMDYFEQTEANVDLKNNVLTLFNGLTAVPMTPTGSLLKVIVNEDVKVPPLSEAAFPVHAKGRLSAGHYMIEGNLQSPCKALAVARALVNATSPNFPCRVLNPTSEEIFLRKGTAVATLCPVEIDRPRHHKKYHCKMNHQ